MKPTHVRISTASVAFALVMGLAASASRDRAVSSGAPVASTAGVRAAAPAGVRAAGAFGVRAAAVDRGRQDPASRMKAPRIREALAAAGTETCNGCHALIENATEAMGFSIACTFCHGGDGTKATMEEAHVQPQLAVLMDETVPPLDYDLPYQRFVNPTNLRVVEDTCGACHSVQVETVFKSLMATAAGHYAGGLYLNGVVDSKTPVYGTFAITDLDGEVPTDRGAVAELQDLLSYDPAGDPSLVSTHFAAVPGQACARCHLWSRGRGFRGAQGADGIYRADGCAACHMPYAHDGRSRSADPSIDHVEPGHTMFHRVTRAIPTEQCLSCHNRGARIGLSFTGRAEMPPRLPSGPGVPGTTSTRFAGSYHYADPATNPPDVHQARGLHCIDCHTAKETMGDGNIYGHMDQATKVDCRTCHGTPLARGTLVDRGGEPLSNVTVVGSRTLLVSKVDAQEHVVPQVPDLLDPDSPSYNPRAKCAMDANHLKPERGLECYACHTSWMQNCFGCHFERDEREQGQNLVTRQWETGKAKTNNKVFESLRHFAMGLNAKGRFSPYVVGCQVIADVTAPDGSKILDFVMPTTANGLSGLGLNPVNPHTVRGAGEVRTCVECHRSPPSLGLGSGNYALARNLAFATSTDGVRVFDRKTDPALPALVGTLPVVSPRALAARPNGIEGTADHLYVAGPAGVSVFDLRAGIPAAPAATIGGIDATDVLWVAQHLYVSVAGTGIQVYDTRDATTPVLVSAIPLPGARRAVLWGIHLFVAAGAQGLVVVEVADPASPAVVGGVAGIHASDVALYAHFRMGSAFAARAYVADPGYGVRVIDLLPNFGTPSLAGGVALPGASGLDTYTRWVPAAGATPSREHDYLYVAAGASGLHVLDITDPDAIAPVAALAELGGMALDVDVASQIRPPGVDDYALVANSLLGVQVVDVTNPASPILRATVPAPGTERVTVEVQQLDRFVDEEGTTLKENSHPGASAMSREDIVRILSTPLDGCSVGGCCGEDGSCVEMTDADCIAAGGGFGGSGTGCSDADGDGAGEACDCAPADGRTWRAPGETSALRLSHAGGSARLTTLMWIAPTDPGASAVTYDTVSSPVARNFTTAAACVETDGTDTVTTHAEAPAQGAVVYFLVRARNACGVGGAGADSSGVSRAVRSCP